jgi:hypothetical protein
MSGVASGGQTIPGQQQTQRGEQAADREPNI